MFLAPLADHYGSDAIGKGPAFRHETVDAENEHQLPPEEQLNQVSCLNLVTNAVVLWNTVYLSAVLDQLRTENHNVDDGDMVICRRRASSTSTPTASIASTSKGNSIAKAFAR